MKISSELINGRIAPGFEKVRDVFVSNFEQGLEIGSACAVFLQGECVVDLWGGYQDIRQKTVWQEDGLALIFSSTKGVAAMCIAMAQSRGWFAYDDPIATYWPAFARNGKEKITFRQLLSHQAGLCAMDILLSVEDLADLTYVDAVIAAQKPLWTPGEYQGYHTYSMGWYMNGIMRHVDPQQRSIRQFLKEEVVEPLGLDMRLSLANATHQEMKDVESRLAHFYS
ncbi:MAG: serine hydrolase domain-containing protein, partial [Chloroflexota bacterium]